jgi:transposase
MGIVVRSVCEPQYEYGNLVIFGYGVKVVKELSEKKRKLGILQAASAGKMGRKVDENTREMVVKLKNSGFMVEEITDLCDISRSTYYRYVKK